MQIIENVSDLKLWRKGQKEPVGFVPTMGALHAGHAELLFRMRKKCETSVLSIFVNPTQFGPTEDFSKYPRTIESDLSLAREAGVDAIFIPTASDMYPPGNSTHVYESELSKELCGRFRPGHFQGVTTIVLKLFNLVEPQLSFFGLKDAQQFFILDKMAKDLNLNTRLEGIPTVRESSGLALSSRNRYLSLEALKTAPVLYAELKNTADQIRNGSTDLESSKQRLIAKGFDVQYLDLLRLPDFNRVHYSSDAPYLLATAVFLEGTRLIDNIILSPELLSKFEIAVQDF